VVRITADPSSSLPLTGTHRGDLGALGVGVRVLVMVSGAAHWLVSHALAYTIAY